MVFLIVCVLSAMAVRAHSYVVFTAEHDTVYREPTPHYDYLAHHNIGDNSIEDGGSRRLFEWFSRLFQTTSPRAPLAGYQRDLNDRILLRALHRNLTAVLHTLSEVQKQVSFAMAQRESYAILANSEPRVGLGGVFYGGRVKREATTGRSNDTVGGNVNPNATTTMTACHCQHDNTNDSDSSAASGRRSASAPSSSTEVKTKLLLYLQESFREINTRISSLRSLKAAFAADVGFKVGYALANLDALEASVLKLQGELERGRLRADGELLRVYDTLRAAGRAVAGLGRELLPYLHQLDHS